MQNKGVIFDLDGTLWDVTESTFYSTNVVTQKHKLKEISKETICNVFGCDKEESAKLYFPELQLSKSLNLMDEIAKVNIENLNQNGGVLYSNLEKVIIELSKKYTLFIVSNTAESKYIEAFLYSSKLKRYFSDYIAASEINISKGEAIKKIISKNNLKNAIYVGDTKKDLEAAKIAQIPFIYAQYGFGKKLKTQYNIYDIKELPGVVKGIFN